MPALVTAWSSTTRTRTGSVDPGRRLGDVGLGRDPGADPRAPSRRRFEIERAAEQSGSLGHAAEPESVLLALVVDLGPIEPRAVVLHQEGDAGGRVHQAHTHRRRSGVSDRVRQRFLGDPEQRVGDLGRRHRPAAGGDEARVDHPRPVRPGDLELERLLERAALQRRRRQPEHAPPRLLEDGLGRGPGLGERLVRVVGQTVGDGALGRPELQQHRHEPLRDRVVHLARHPVALGRGGLGAGVRFRRLVETGVGDRDRRVLGEQLEQFGILVDERPAGIAGEHHQRADDVPAPPDGDADHALERFPVLGTDVPAGNVAVVREDHRASPGHERAGGALREREHLAGLARDPDVGLLAIDAGRLVHQADRAGVAAQELRRTLEDPLEERAERQLAGQVLDDRAERLGRFPSIGRPAAPDGAVRCAISAGDHDQRGPFREGSPAGNPRSFRANGQSGTCRRGQAFVRTTLNRHGSRPPCACRRRTACCSNGHSGRA